MPENVEIICVEEAKHAAAKCKSLSNRMRKCIDAVVNHWLATDDNVRLRCAVAACYALSSDKERCMIKIEWDFLKTLAAGIPLPDLSQCKRFKALGILGMWQDAVKKREVA